MSARHQRRPWLSTDSIFSQSKGTGATLAKIAQLLGGCLVLLLVVLLAACSSSAASQAQSASPSTSAGTGSATPSTTANASATAGDNGGGGGTNTPLNVYVGASDGTVYSIDANSGAKHWQVPVGGMAAKPTVVTGIVYVATDGGHVAALGSGSSLWNVTPGGTFDARPAVDNNVVLVGSDESNAPNFYALNAGDGSTKWTFNANGAISSSAAVANGLVYFGCADSYFYAVHENDGSLAWKTKVSAPIEFTSPALANGMVFTGDDYGNVTAMNASSGTIVWSHQMNNNQIGGRLAVVNNLVYFSASNQVVIAAHISDGSIAWQYKTAGSTLGTPNVVNGVVYIADTVNMNALNASSGSLLWHKTTNNFGPQTWPSVRNGTVYMGGNDGTLYSFDANSGHINWTFKAGNGLGSPQAG